MNANTARRFTLRGSSLLLATLGVWGMAPSAYGQEPPPEVIYLTGSMRDFQRSHVDFDVVPSGGTGHYAMNVELDMPPSGLPALWGQGFKVLTQWRDRESHPIAPHLYAGGAGVVRVGSAPVRSPSTTIDTWSSLVGPYGGLNVGPEPTFYVGATMPELTEPTGMGPSVGDLVFGGGGTTTISHDLHCEALSIRDMHTIRIDGEVTILCETAFDIRDGASIVFTSDGVLNLYTKGAVSFRDATIGSDKYDPARFNLYHLGDTNIVIADGAQVWGTIVAPNGGLYMPDNSDFYGRYTGGSLQLDNQAGFHIDERMTFDNCNVLLNDTRGTAGTASLGGITSAETFNQWYRDILGINLGLPYRIALTRNPSGVYEYLSDEFYPIDGLLYGNEGAAHNYFFTFTFSTSFTYDACSNQFVEFQGCDDAWMFVDNALVMDLGGVVPGTGQYVDMDRAELVDGQTYQVRFFYAQRNPYRSEFRLRTNIPFEGSGYWTVSAAFD